MGIISFKSEIRAHIDTVESPCLRTCALALPKHALTKAHRHQHLHTRLLDSTHPFQQPTQDDCTKANAMRARRLASMPVPRRNRPVCCCVCCHCLVPSSLVSTGNTPHQQLRPLHLSFTASTQMYQQSRAALRLHRLRALVRSACRQDLNSCGRGVADARQVQSSKASQTCGKPGVKLS